MQQYKAKVKGFLKTPLENEAEWDKILRSGYATGERSYTPASIGGNKQKEAIIDTSEQSADSDEVPETNTLNKRIQPYIVEVNSNKRNSITCYEPPSKKNSRSSREDDINTCLEQLRKSCDSQTSKALNPFDEVQNKLEVMGIVDKYGDEFVVDILDSFRGTPGAIDLFNSLRSDTARLHYLRKHCLLEDDVYKPMPIDDLNY